jgi:hypothetical protein
MKHKAPIVIAARSFGHTPPEQDGSGNVLSRRIFTGREIGRLRLLVRRSNHRDETIRRAATMEMEDLGFYPAEFCPDYHPDNRRLSAVEFDDLIGLGVIRVADRPHDIFGVTHTCLAAG